MSLCPLTLAGEFLFARQARTSPTFTIPERLKKKVGIEREVVLVGMMTKFAIWSPERWADEAPDETRDNPSQLLKEVRV